MSDTVDQPQLRTTRETKTGNQIMMKDQNEDSFPTAKGAGRDESGKNVTRLVPRYGSEAKSKSRWARPITDGLTGDDDPGPNAA